MTKYIHVSGMIFAKNNHYLRIIYKDGVNIRKIY